MPDVKRQIKLVTEQRITDKPQQMEGFPMRAWSIEIWLLNEQGEEVPANIFERATYRLHPSFEKRAVQSLKKPPFRIEEEGWGEFEMQIILSGVAKGGDHSIDHDLNFQTERYEAKHWIVFKNPKPELLTLLKESGSVPGEENGARSRSALPSAKKKKDKAVDMEKLADGLQRLGEDDLLQVVQMVHDNKTQDTYTKNDVENGEFHVDLYTLPDNLVKMLWDFTTQRTEL
ncbi:YEATS domain-containing protein [Neofusicoccum parvum]|uniref:YEATS domain-containing protein n=2 Tax=Neofusicoccum parvum TaxID=310453 RepID=A0ACB5S7I7_9PEZI|nr:putative transcription initiation factor subunit protein [Neofusicoccum parvum UCRNP2]GME28759.1 YEATS domain-containing protein [Neofusicoccum parvum]GME57602.1 YEATS domain-containing protein [Neofusicoccum parvum]